MQIFSVADIAQILEAFIRERFLVSPDDSYFNQDTKLWSEGYLDSVGAVELVSFLQDRFHLSMPLEELAFHPDFVNIRGIARLVSQAADGSARARRERAELLPTSFPPGYSK